MTKHHNASRRELIKRIAALGSLGTAAPFALNLAGIGAASAQSTSDYRAIVCLFMSGGNDQNNTIVPYDSASYAVYQAARSGLELPYSDLLEIVPTTSQGSGRRFSVPTELTELRTLFTNKKAAVLGNVGPILGPTTLADFLARRNLPGRLFSHNDQVATWQAYQPEGVRVGWGGRIGDLLMSQNSDSTFTSISASGNAVLMSGNTTVQYQISTSGAVTIGLAGGSPFTSSSAAQAIRTLSMSGGTSLLEQDQSAVVKRSYDAAAKINSALAGYPATGAAFVLPGALASDSLGLQLQVVLRMMAARSTLGAKRQVFFVNIGGFDTHDDQLDRQRPLLARVSKAIDYFYKGTVSLGIDSQATLFTASDFGRTLASNGDGSDHAWGGHHFIVGGAVKGGDIYGSMPEVRISTTANPHPLDTGGGRYIPTTSVDQYAVTLAKWMGVAQSDFALVAPNIGKFSAPTLGFI
ncbi:Tat pathway signal protein [Pelomonas sp. HMWF004]|nr:Tat pathway signal protein [Pelomonas sp. HMWF004]